MKKIIKFLLMPILSLISSCCGTKEEIIRYLQPDYIKTGGTLYFNDISPILNSTDQEFASIYQDIHFLPEKYQLISEQKIRDVAFSSSSKKEALENALLIKTDNNSEGLHSIGTSSTFVLETDLFYIVNVTWDSYFGADKHGSYENNVISFKKEYVECNSIDKYTMKIIDFTKTQEIIDTFMIGLDDFNIDDVFVCSNLVEENDVYVYTSYTMHASYSFGDCGKDNRLSLLEREWSLDKETGIADFQINREIRRIYF